LRDSVPTVFLEDNSVVMKFVVVVDNDDDDDDIYIASLSDLREIQTQTRTHITMTSPKPRSHL